MPLDVQAPLAVMWVLDDGVAGYVETEHTQDRTLSPQVSDHGLLGSFGNWFRANRADNNEKSREDRGERNHIVRVG
jgi:hypothetical protein